METVLDPVLDRMPPLDIDSARMLRQEKELKYGECIRAFTAKPRVVE